MDVKKVAGLARLKLRPEEEAQFQTQLKSICEFFEQISGVNTEGVLPLVTPTEMETLYRKDEASKVWSSEEAIENAPEKSGHLFKVPPVV